MTEQEAEVWRKRLVRVWAPMCVQMGVVLCSGDTSIDYEARISAKDPIEIRLLFAETGPERLLLSLESTLPGTRCPLLVVSPTKGVQIAQRTENEVLLARQWLPFFRRGCWLSGCPIEATAHEKAEWMRGFTHEEVEAWNLKM